MKFGSASVKGLCRALRETKTSQIAEQILTSQEVGGAAKLFHMDRDWKGLRKDADEINARVR